MKAVRCLFCWLGECAVSSFLGGGIAVEVGTESDTAGCG